MGVAIVLLANVRFFGVVNVRIWGWEMTEFWGWEMSSWQMTHNQNESVVE